MLSMIKGCITFCLSFLLSGLLCAFAEDGAGILSLNDAIRRALDHNRDLQSSLDRVKNADITVEAAKWDFRIRVRPNISGLYQKDEVFEQLYGLSDGLAVGGPPAHCKGVQRRYQPGEEKALLEKLVPGHEVELSPQS